MRRAQPIRPYYVVEVNQDSACTIDYSSRDNFNALEAPDTLEYRIDDLTNSEIVKGWTSIPDPDEEGSLVIPASLNGMTRQYRDKQLNQITFRATYADGQQIQSMAYIELCAVFQGVA